MNLRSSQPEMPVEINASAGASPSTRPRWRPAVRLAVTAGIGCALWFLWQYLHLGMVHYRQGMEYAAANDMAKAEQEWQKGVQEDPSFAGCYEKLGDLYSASRNYPAAAEKYAAAAERSPRDRTLFLRLARAQQAMNEVQAAAASARRAAELAPGDADANALYGHIALKTCNLSAAHTALRRAHNFIPADSAVLHDLAHAELDSMDLTGAEQDLTPWLQAHPKDAEANSLMAEVYSRKTPTPETVRTGLKYAERGAGGMPKDVRAHVVLGQFYLVAKRPQDALRTYLTVDGPKSSDEAVLQGLVDCYNRLGKPEQARQIAARLRTVIARHEHMYHLKRILNAAPATVDAGIALARLDEEDGDPSIARADYLRILRQAPRDTRTHAALAAFYRRTGKPDLADKVEDPDSVADGP